MVEEVVNRLGEWTEAERQVWAPPEKLTVSEWADKYRVIQKSSEPGPWRTERTPYLRAIMDAMGDETTQELVVMKTPQVGCSEASRNGLAYWIAHDPAPCLIVFPTEPAARENLTDFVIPMLEVTPKLRQYITGNQRDLKASGLHLSSMDIYAGHAASPSSLATRPCRYVICDETDKYPPFSGREADPVRLAGHRQKTYVHRRKLVLISTPTTKAGLIFQNYEQTSPDHRFAFNLPCGSCGKYQKLTWARIRWGTGQTVIAGGPMPEDELSRIRLATDIENLQVPVWYDCLHCDAKWTMHDRHLALGKGEWQNDKGVPLKDCGTPSRLAFHIQALYSPWVSWSAAVGAFLRSRSSHAAMMDFMNGWLGEPFEEELNKLEASIFEEKANKGAPRGILPTWTRYLIASADTGGRDAWFVVRAWGAQYRSQLIDWGHVHSLEELKQKALNTYYNFTENARPPMAPQLLVIDTGGTYDVMDEHASRTDQVYKFCVQDKRIAGVKGNVKQEKPISPRLITFKPPGGQSPYDVTLNHINVHYFKDVLSESIHQKLGGNDLWACCQGLDDVYCQQMASEHRILVREGTKTKMVWQPITKGLPNHLWDCEVYNRAGADMIRVDLLPPDDPTISTSIPAARMGMTPATRPVQNPHHRPYVSRRPR